MYIYIVSVSLLCARVFTYCYFVRNWMILSTLMIEAVRSSETLVTRATRLHIPEDDILHSQSRENLKSYIALTAWVL
jgi:hypothetical protein